MAKAKSEISLGITALIVIGIIGVVAVAGSYFAFYYVPPPTTKTSSNNCISTVSNSPNSTLEFSVNSVNITLTVEPAVSQVQLMGCNYKTTSTNTPIRCGTMCGGGLGSINYYSDVLQFNMSMVGVSHSLNYSAILQTQQTPELSSLFLPYRSQVYVNSQLANWNSTPSCVEGSVAGTVYEPNCVVDNYSIMTVTFPANVAILAQNSSIFEVIIDSSETLVP
ncbi:MAG: hypothetical protein JRN52_13615 [Nitrososphaerota archaeon]|nr:hypothetical protein [Nitrososphaerota archaeon]